MPTNDMDLMMWNEATSTLKEALSTWVNSLTPEDRGKPLAKALSGGREITPESILHDVESNTEEGKRIVRDWTMLTFKAAMNHILKSSQITEG